MKGFGVKGCLVIAVGPRIGCSSAERSTKDAPNRFTCVATRAAVVYLTKSVAAGFFAKGIHRNAVYLNVGNSFSLHERRRSTRNYEGQVNDFGGRQPIGCPRILSEIVNLATYLASSERAYRAGRSHIIV